MASRRAPHPGTEWRPADVQAGRAMAREWQRFFASRVAETPEADLTPTAADRVRDEHEARLLRYPNVVGVTVGFAMRRGRATRTPAIVVYVSKKVPRRRLAPADRIPASLDGVWVDVVEVGPVEALPTRAARPASSIGSPSADERRARP